MTPNRTFSSRNFRNRKGTWLWAERQAEWQAEPKITILVVDRPAQPAQSHLVAAIGALYSAGVR